MAPSRFRLARSGTGFSLCLRRTFLTAGGAALAGSYKTANTTTTWVPLTDINGSTIGLVNSASPTSPPGATYTYDPSGNVSVNGSNVTSWPFQYQGMEHELTDPANLYFNSSSNVYNSQIQNALSQVGAQGLGGSSGANPAGPAIAPPSGQSGGLTWQKYQNDLKQGYKAYYDASNFSISYGNDQEAPLEINLGPIVAPIDFLTNLLEDLFSGPENPPVPRQLMHKRHPVYGEILGVVIDNIPTEGSTSPVAGSGVSLTAVARNRVPSTMVARSGIPSNAPPLLRAGYSGQIIPVDSNSGGSKNRGSQGGFADCLLAAGASEDIVFPIVCVASGIGCVNAEAPGLNVLSCKVAIGTCTVTAAMVAACAAGTPLPQ